MSDLSFKRMVYLALILVSLSLPILLPSLHGKLILVLSLLWLLSRPKFNQVFRSKLLYIFILIVGISLFGFIISNNIGSALDFFETIIVLLILPIIILSIVDGANNQFLLKIGSSFTIGVLTLNLVSLYFISYDLWDSKNLQSNLIAANNIIVKIHPAFLSMYISFCVFFIIDQYFPLKNLDRKKLGWVTFSLVVLLVFLVWLNSRAGILAFCLAALFYIRFKWSGKTRLVGLVGLAIFFLLIILLPFSKHRFLSAPKMVLTGKVSGFENDPSVYPLLNRIQVLKCDVELLKWPEIFYGYGTGDFRDELQVCFAANGYERPFTESMDSHSEYFAQLHRHGIIGLVLFLALLIVPFRHAFKYKCPLLGAFIILFAVTALFENVFSAQKGVTFFALFCPLLWLFAKQEYKAKLNDESSPRF